MSSNQQIIDEANEAYYEGRHDDARRLAGQMLNAEPTSEPGLQMMARVLCTAGDYSLAKEYIEELLRSNPSSVAAQLDLIDIRQHLESDYDPREDVRTIVDQHAEDRDALLTAIHVLILGSHHDSALELLSQIPVGEDRELDRLRCDVAFAMATPEEVQKILAPTFEAGLAEAEDAILLADSMRLTGNKEEGAELLKEYTSRYPRHAGLKRDYAVLCALNGDFASADIAAAEHRALGPPVWYISRLDGMIASFAGRRAEAVRHLKSALRERPDDIETLSVMANTQIDCGERRAAIDTLSQLLRYWPDTEWALRHKARLLLRTFRFKEAVKAWIQYTRLLGSIHDAKKILARTRQKQAE